MSLDDQDNERAIEIIVELYGVSEEEARRLWEKFLESIKKMKAITQMSASPSNRS